MAKLLCRMSFRMFQAALSFCVSILVLMMILLSNMRHDEALGRAASPEHKPSAPKSQRVYTVYIQRNIPISPLRGYRGDESCRGLL